MEGVMHKRIVVISLVVFLVGGCGRAKEPVVIQIGDISASAADFERAFRHSPYSAADTPDSRKEFLDNYINRMLILQEAVDRRLDRDKEFLSNVEAFWQQSLIKIMLDRKIKEIAGSVSVSDAEVQAYYQAHKAADYMDKDLQSVYNSIKWKLLNDKQQEAVNGWLDSLRKSSKIRIDYNSLKVNK